MSGGRGRIKPGARIAGRFVVEHDVASGGTGTVYKALDVERDEMVALKVLHAGRTGGERFQREVALLSDLRHPGIVRYVAHGTTSEGRVYLVTEWLEGETLERRLVREDLGLADAIALVRRVAEPLAFAHARGVVHRDIKPSNVFLLDGDLEKIRLLDFGAARLDEPGVEVTRTGMLVGTPGYMAPEQARGDRRVDARADVFALGCVLFECLTGRPAFKGAHALALLTKILVEEPPRPSEVRPGIPEAVDEVVARMLSKDPAQRLADGAKVREALAAIDLDRAPGTRGPGSKRQRALTGAEQTLASVILVHAGDSEDESIDFDLRATEPVAVGAVEPPPVAVRRVAEAHGASVEPMLGGAMALTFRSGGVATDQALRAAHCALSLRAAARGVPIAVATGRAAKSGRMLLGEAIDRAARMLAASVDALLREPRPAIRVDNVTAALLSTRFEVSGDDRGLVLVGRRDHDVVRTLLGRPTPCVGRDLELRMLTALFEECAEEGVARVALVTGQAGVGKSRLAHELVRTLQARETKLELWTARGDPISAGSSFALAGRMIRRAAGIRDGEALEARREKLVARVARHVDEADVQRVAEFLGEIVGAPFSDEESVPLRSARRDPTLMGDQIGRAFQDLVAAECAAHPLLVLLDDMQWGDVPTVGLLDTALRVLEGRPLLVIAFARPEVTHALPRLFADRDMQWLRLGGLSAKASARFVQSMLGASTPPDVVGRLVERAAGNAFYLEELVRAVAEGKGDKLPDTVLASVEARLGALTPAARRVLRAASVFGTTFSAGGVRALLGTEGGEGDGADARDLIEGLVALELVDPQPDATVAGEPAYAFRQDMVREAAYAMLTEADRVLGHRLAAEWLEQAGEIEPMKLAEHFERGRAPERAIGWYRRAAEQALDGNDFEAAIARADKAVRCGAEGKTLGALRLVQAKACAWLGDTASAERHASAAMAVLPRGGEAWCSAAAELAAAAVRLVHIERLAALGDELCDRLAASPTTPLVAAGGRAAQALFACGRYEQARTVLAACERAARTIAVAEPTALARIHQARARRALAEGDPVTYLELSTAAAEAFDRAGDTRSACQQRSNAAHALLEVGSPEQAERMLQAALADATRMGLRYVVAAVRSNLGWALAREGRIDEAKRAQIDTIEAARALGDQPLEGGARTYLALTLLFDGDAAAAEREARAAVKVLEAVPPQRAYALAALSRALLRIGRWPEAKEVAASAMDIVERLGGIEEGEGLVRLAWAEALRAAGDEEAAKSAIEVARARLVARGERIRDERFRECFLRHVPEHVHTMALAAAWTGAPAT